MRRNRLLAVNNNKTGDSALDTGARIRTRAHQVVDQLDIHRLAALVRLLGEEFFTPEEFKKILERINSADDVADTERLKDEPCHPWSRVKDEIEARRRRPRTISSS